jgi:hypothetical protein
MRKSVSAEYNIFAQAAGKTIHWKVSMKKTNSLSELQSEGTWIDVSDYLENSMPGKIDDRIELGENQFISASLTLKGLDIAWWKTNIFNATDYLEVKIEFWINNLTADAITLFGGWVDKKGDQFCAKYNERKNTVEFTVYSYQEYAQRMSAVTLVQCPYEDNIYSGNPGLPLNNMSGVWIINANVSGYVLKKGVHKIDYDYNAGSPRLRLDNGTWVSVSTGLYTLTSESGLEKVEVYTTSGVLPTGTSSTDIIVISAGTTLPNIWYRYNYIFDILKTIAQKMGVTQYELDQYLLSTYDDSYITSYYGRLSIEGTGIAAIAFDKIQNWLWIGTTDGKVYIRDIDTNQLSLAGTITGTSIRIEKFFMEKVGSGEIWGIASNSSNVVIIFKIDHDLNKSQWTLSLTNTVAINGMVLATGIGSAGAIYFVNNDYVSVYYFDLSLASEVDTSINLDYYGIQYSGGCGWTNGNDYFVLVTSTTSFPHTRYLIRVYKSGSTWYKQTKNGGSSFTFNIQYGIYNILEQRYIFTDTSSQLRAYNHSTDNFTSISGGIPPQKKNYTYDEDNGIVYYFCASIVVFKVQNNVLSSFGNIRLPDNEFTGIPINNFNFVFDNLEERFWGTFLYTRILFQFCQYSSMFLEEELDGENKTLWDALVELCEGFNLLPSVSSNKKLYTYRRSDDDGNIITTGQSITLNANNAKDITQETGAEETYDMVKVSNGISEESYDGTTFGVKAFDNEKVYEIENPYIPPDLLKTFAVWMWKYWSVSHKRYSIPTPLIPFFQYGPYDGAVMNFSGKIVEAGTGIIVGQSISRNGATEFEVTL